MDFKRIQMLLLAFFIIFDCYLVYILFSRVGMDMPSNIVTESNIVEELSMRNVKVKDLSDKRAQLPLVKTQPSQVLGDHLENLEEQSASVDEDGVLTSAFATPIDLGFKLSYKTKELTKEDIAKLDQVVQDKRHFIMGDHYEYYRYAPLENAVYYRMKAYDNYKIIDGTAEIKLLFNSDSQLTNYVQTYQDKIESLDTIIQTISEQEALQVINGRAETNIPDNSQIDLIRLSYYRMTYLKDFSVYAPVWEIVYSLSDNSVRVVYVDASRGTIISPS